MKYFVGALLLMVSTSAMAAGSSSGYGMGGQFARFDPVVAQYNSSGELFRIEGHCPAQYHREVDQPHARSLQAKPASISRIQSPYGHARVPHDLRTGADQQIWLQGLSEVMPESD
jgi:hypothetical protein